VNFLVYNFIDPLVLLLYILHKITVLLHVYYVITKIDLYIWAVYSLINLSNIEFLL
jgi:hypothetical protein